MIIGKRFIPYYGPDAKDLTTNENHLQFKWVEPGTSVCFSCARHGAGLTCHFCSDIAGLFKIHQAIDEFIKFSFWLFPWCEALIGIVLLDEVAWLIEKHGFKFVKSFDEKRFYILKRESLGE
ncbi:MAG: hypothetical protein KJP07_13570 [Desulfatitalea sp.]|nr:hypothetical protein [Desulfatitalea sp.]